MRRIVPTARSPEFHPPATASLHPPIAAALEAPPLDDPSSDEVLVPSSLLQTLVDESPFDVTLEVESLDVESLEESPSIVMGSFRSISTG
jgi:hypothetical protein